MMKEVWKGLKLPEIYIVDLINLISNEDRAVRIFSDKNKVIEALKDYMNHNDFEVADVFKIKNGEQIIKQEGILAFNTLDLVDGETGQCISLEKGFFITTTEFENDVNVSNVLFFYHEDELIEFFKKYQDEYSFTSVFRVDLDSLSIEPMKYSVENFKYKVVSALNQEGGK